MSHFVSRRVFQWLSVAKLLNSASTMLLPSITTEICSSVICVDTRHRRVPFASGVRAMLIIVMSEIEQLRLQVGRGPEKRAVQAFSA
jgi:hypothetical protein